MLSFLRLVILIVLCLLYLLLASLAVPVASTVSNGCSGVDKEEILGGLQSPSVFLLNASHECISLVELDKWLSF